MRWPRAEHDSRDMRRRLHEEAILPIDSRTTAADLAIQLPQPLEPQRHDIASELDSRNAAPFIAHFESGPARRPARSAAHMAIPLNYFERFGHWDSGKLSL